MRNSIHESLSGRTRVSVGRSMIDPSARVTEIVALNPRSVGQGKGVRTNYQVKADAHRSD